MSRALRDDQPLVPGFQALWALLSQDELMSDEVCYCVVGLHEECVDPQDHEVEGFISCCCWKVEEINPSKPALILGGYKSNEEVKDITSTGRKRAAALYPLKEGMLCEWSGLRYAGGGIHPIIGCNQVRISTKPDSGPRQGNIHHGPDKNTLNNEPENVHRICSTCHNRWHTLNDPYYGERPLDGSDFLPLEGEAKPHDPVTKASLMAVFKWEAYWHTDKKDREPIENVNFDE